MKKVIVVLILFLLVGAGVGTYFFLNKSENTKKEKEKEKIVYTDASLDENIKIAEDLNVEWGKIRYL